MKLLKSYLPAKASLSIILLIVLSSLQCQKNEATQSQAAEKIKAGALIVDVRTPEEFQNGHFPGAVNIPVDQVENRLGEFGAREKPVVVYCRSGNRSGRAQKLLISKGWVDVTNGGALSEMLRLSN